MKKLMLVFAIFSILGLQIYAQNTVTGKVTADNGSALPGVSVLVKGTTIGTMTLSDGTYSIKVPDGSKILVFSYIGMKSQEVTITGNVVNVKMQPSSEALDEVVVTALGISREKKSLGYAVQNVSGDELNRSNNENIINSISGKVSGIQIRNNTNMGGSSNILLRGSSSLTGNNQVLFVVDGVPVDNTNTNNSGQRSGRSGYDYGNPISDINPNDIAGINVLKGAAATALYGSRAANGVIIITTKKGQKSKDGGKNLSVGVNSSTMFHYMDKSTFPEYQTNYGQGYGPYYSGPIGDGQASDYWGLYHYDFDGDGELDYITPTTEDASMGSRYNPDLMVYQYDAFYPDLPTYMEKSPYVMGANGPEYFFQRGRTFTNSVDISGGTAVSTFRLAYTNTDETGLMPNSSLKKNNVLFNGSFDVSDNITVTASANYTNNQVVGRNHTGYSDNILSSFRQWFNLGVDMAQQKEFFELTDKNITWNPVSENNLSPIYWDNPYWQRYKNFQSDERNRLIGYTQIDWKINDYLNFMSKYSVDHYTTIQEERKAVGSVAGEFGVGRPDVQSGYARNQILFTETNFDAMLRFNKNLSDDINLNGLIGTNIRRNSYDQVYASTNGGLAVPGVYALSNSASPMLPPEETYQKIGVNGVFLSASLGYKNMFFLDGSIRRDVSSTLPVENNAYIYPSVSASFLFSEMLNKSWLNLGKFRINYAKVGNDAPWGSVEDAYRIVSPFNGNTLVRFPSYKNNPELKPELSGSIEAGLEMSMFDNRLGFDFALYKTNTIDQVVPLSVSYVTGYASKFVNIGEVENKGIELMLRGTVVKKKDLSWNITLNWAKNTNKVISLGDDIDNLQLAALQGGVTINAREGEPYGVIQGTDFVYAPDGQKVIGSNGYYEKTPTSDQIIGNTQPDWNAGITNTIQYKNFTASFLIDMQMGGSIFSLDQWYGMGTGLYAETDYMNDLGNPVRDPIYDTDGNMLLPYFDLPGYDPANGYGSNSGGLILDGVVGEDTNGDGEYDTYTENIRRMSGGDYRIWGWSKNPNAAFVYDATYVKLREASIGYNLPKSVTEKLSLTNATISVIGSNLWIMYKALPHADPEASQGAGNIQGWQSGVFPTARNIGFSINLTF